MEAPRASIQVSQGRRIVNYTIPLHQSCGSMLRTITPMTFAKDPDEGLGRGVSLPRRRKEPWASLGCG